MDLQANHTPPPKKSKSHKAPQATATKPPERGCARSVSRSDSASQNARKLN